MKKIFIVILLSLILNSIFATSQTLYDKSSHEYYLTQSFAELSGIIGPSTATPITADELLLVLNRINTSNLPITLKQEYEQLVESLSTPTNIFDATFKLAVSPQLFLSTNAKTRDDFFIPYRDEIPGIEFGSKVSFGENIFLEGYIPIVNSPYKQISNLNTSFDWFLNYKNGHFNFMGANATGQLAEIPKLARGSIGNKWANIILGRSRHSMGLGYTGNLLIGDNFNYQELLKLSFFSNPFTYNISLTHFDEQDGLESFKTASFGGKHQTRVVHRFDFNIFDKVRAVVNLGTLYYVDSAFDIRWLTPFMIAHNYYNYDESTILTSGDEANNIFSFEVEAAVAPKWTVSAQFILDQFQTFFEDKGALPMACGALLNLSYTTSIDNAILKIWAEGVYTSKYLYRNEKYDDGNKQNPNYNYDYILGYHRRAWQTPEISYTGYQYGPDSFVVASGFSYNDIVKNYEISSLLQYRNQGASGIYYPTFTVPDLTREHIITLTTLAKWTWLPSLDIFGGASASVNYNTNHNAGDVSFTPQLYFGLKWNIL